MDDNMFNRLSIISDSDFDRIYSEDEQPGEEPEAGEPETINGESADELQQLIQIESDIRDYAEKTYQATMCIIYFLVFAFVFKLIFKNIFSWLNGG